jgi:hypothetical protein
LFEIKKNEKIEKMKSSEVKDALTAELRKTKAIRVNLFAPNSTGKLFKKLRVLIGILILHDDITGQATVL